MPLVFHSASWFRVSCEAHHRAAHRSGARGRQHVDAPPSIGGAGMRSAHRQGCATTPGSLGFTSVANEELDFARVEDADIAQRRCVEPAQIVHRSSDRQFTPKSVVRACDRSP